VVEDNDDGGSLHRRGLLEDLRLHGAPKESTTTTTEIVIMAEDEFAADLGVRRGHHARMNGVETRGLSFAESFRAGCRCDQTGTRTCGGENAHAGFELIQKRY